jgi:hypothetical protein
MIYQQTHKILTGKAQGKRRHERPKSRRIILKWILKKWDAKEWIGLPQDRVPRRTCVNTTMNAPVPERRRIVGKVSR